MMSAVAATKRQSKVEDFTFPTGGEAWAFKNMNMQILGQKSKNGVVLLSLWHGRNVTKICRLPQPKQTQLMFSCDREVLKRILPLSNDLLVHAASIKTNIRGEKEETRP